MSDETVAQFAAVTGAAPDRAQQYLNISDNNIEQAIQLWYETGGIDLMESAPAAPEPVPSSSNPPPIPQSTRPPVEREVVQIDSDSDDTGGAGGGGGLSGGRSTNAGAPAAAAPASHSIEDDEAMARRLQEEMYGGGAAPGGFMTPGVDEDSVRAPIARTTETLVGPEPYNMNDPAERRAAVAEQMFLRRQAAMAASAAGPGRPSIWDQSEDFTTRVRRQVELGQGSSSRGDGGLSSAGGSTGTSASKTTMLAEMYRPPFDLMSRMSWDEARDDGKANEKWILVNVQDPSIFDCQVLNRDIWKHNGVCETVRENFIFLQYSKDDPRGDQYVQYYFQNRDVESSYPHIAIVDPRTGEQVKVWSGAPAPKAMDFLMQLHEFLDRYSLSAAAKNPVAKRKAEPKKEAQVDRMTEAEQLEMAMQASLAQAAAGSGASAEGGSGGADPDDLTRSIPDMRAVDAAAKDAEMTDADDDEGTGANGDDADEDVAGDAVFARIPSDHPHVEPAQGLETTRIQFRHPDGRVVRRFGLAEPVQRLYEWLKAEPLSGTKGRRFGLVFMGRNLVADVEAGNTVETAGLKNGSVNVEFVES